MKKIYFWIMFFFFFVASVISFLVYGVEAVSAAQLIAIWLPLLAIYHYFNNIVIICTSATYITAELAVCFLCYITAYGVGESSALAVHQVVVTGAALWSIIMTLQWAGISFAKKNKEFIYKGQIFTFATCICTLCSVIISFFTYMPKEWFANGGIQVLTALSVYAISSLFVRSYATK